MLRSPISRWSGQRTTTAKLEDSWWKKTRRDFGQTTSKASSGKLHIKWVRSAICAPVKHKLVVKGLGFTRLNQIVEREDSPSIRGMVKKIPHLVRIVD